MPLARAERDPGEHREHQANDRETEYILHHSREVGRIGGKISIRLRPAGNRIAVDDRKAGENEHAARGDTDPRLNTGGWACVENAKSRENWKHSAEHEEDADDDGAARRQLIGVRS
jgi:hypothetical protein